MTPEDVSLHYYYVGAFAILLLLLYVLRKLSFSTSSLTSSASSSSVAAIDKAAFILKASTSPEFLRFQRLYLVVYLFMMGADWLQGPYVYALYSHYGFSIRDIAVLFIVGFGSSLLFGTIVGSMADRYGRKTLCILFGVFYACSCLTKHFNHFYMLLIGRLLGGISTSILFSSFESWMVSEHHRLGFPEELLSLTFSLGTMGNGIIAIVAGVVASLVREQSAPWLHLTSALCCFSQARPSLHGIGPRTLEDSQVNLWQTLSHAVHRLKSDQKMVLLGVIQSFFEGAMYVFVFMWTPALSSTSFATGHKIYHGWIFASFMICVLIGSGIFEHAVLKWQVRVERVALWMFIISSASLLLPAFTSSHTVRLCSFFVFEVCVGMFWPLMGTMRSRYVPEQVRATVMNLFRVPLNLIVVLILINIDRLSELQVFALCFICMLPAILCQWRLCTLVESKLNTQGKSNADDLHSEADMSGAELDDDDAERSALHPYPHSALGGNQKLPEL